MYSNVHGVIGTSLMLGTYAITKDETLTYLIGMPLAFLSHDLLDRLGEKGYGAKTLIYEAVPFVLFIALAFISHIPTIYFAGWFCGNTMDLIDKKLYIGIYSDKIISKTSKDQPWLAKIVDKYFRITHFFKCHRRKPNIDFNRKQTIIATVISSLIITVLTILMIL